MKLSVVIPARNEEETLPRVLGDLQRVVPNLTGWDVEIIVVDDRSTDRTAELARCGGATVVANPRRSGKGMALRAGFEASTGDVIAMMDADYSHRAEEMPLFLEAIQRDGVGLVIGSRVVGGSEEYHHVRALGNVFLSASLGLATGRYL
ncbi:MAG: glycosyltransferase family 2 protein, partial [Gemmatimonadales bacterium]